MESSRSLDWNHRYQICLMELARAFCGILRRFNEVPQPDITLLCSGKNHHPLLLRQRNAELVAMMVANLAPACPPGLAELWTTAKEVFGYDFIRAYHLRYSTLAEITPKLATSFSKYNGKDALIVVVKDRSKGSPFSILERQPGMRNVLFDQICPQPSIPAVAATSADLSPSTPTDSPEEEYTPAETEATTKIQRQWRSYSRKIKNRRSYMELPEARAIAHFISLGAECPATLAFIDGVALRDTLISKGVTMSLRLAEARDTLSKVQKDAMRCVDNVKLSTEMFKTIDDVLHGNSQVETLLRSVEEKMSDECIVGVVKMGSLTALEKAMQDVEDIVAEAEQMMLETRNMVDAVSRNCT